MIGYRKIMLFITSAVLGISFIFAGYLIIDNSNNVADGKNKISLSYYLGEIEIDDTSLYTDKPKITFINNNKSDLDINNPEIDKLFANPEYYAVAEVPLTITNNCNQKITNPECKLEGTLPNGVWLDRCLFIAYLEVVEKGQLNQTIRFLYNKDESNKGEIEKLLKTGEISISFKLDNAKLTTIPINPATATFAF